MKLNISNPATGAVKSISVDDEKKLRIFYDKRIAQEVAADALGDEFKGYIFKITGGNDKQGFPMMQGVLVPHRVRLLFKTGMPCYRPRRKGERKRKSVRGCILGPDLSAINLVVTKKGEGELPDLTDKYVPRRLGPKTAPKIRKLFNLSKEDDVRKYVIRRQLPDRTRAKDGKVFHRSKAPKIQRLVTPRRIHHKKQMFRDIKRLDRQHKVERINYECMLAQRAAAKEARRASSRRTSSKRTSQKRTAEEETDKTASKKAKTDKTETGKKVTIEAPAKGAVKGAAKGSAKATAKATGKAVAKEAANAAVKAAAKATGKSVAKQAAAAATKKEAEKPAKAAVKAVGKAVAKQAAAKAAAKTTAAPSPKNAKASPKPAAKKAAKK